MNANATKKLRNIEERQMLAIVRHIGRYGMATFSTARQLLEFDGCGLRTVKRALKECQRRNWIGSAWLDQTRKYWFLQKKGATSALLNVPKTGPLSEPAKIRAAALLFFCMNEERPRHLLKPLELQGLLNGEQSSGLPTGFYLDPSGSSRLGLARVDAGRQGQWDRIIESVRCDIDRLLKNPGLSQINRRGQFEISVITVLPEKAARLRTAMQNYSDLNRISVNVVDCPELVPLVSSTLKKKGH
jgi:hypothetical protein